MKERIRIVADYEIEYERADARADAIDAALEGDLRMRGDGPRGCYSATRLGLTISGGTAMETPKQESLL